MAGQTLGIHTPVSSHSLPNVLAATTAAPPPLRWPASTRTRRNHGAFTLGGQLACVYSTRRAARSYGVQLEVGAGTLTLASAMTPSQARAMATALNAAANAAEAVQEVAA
jgi:hypothetical protein